MFSKISEFLNKPICAIPVWGWALLVTAMILFHNVFASILMFAGTVGIILAGVCLIMGKTNKAKHLAIASVVMVLIGSILSW